MSVSEGYYAIHKILDDRLVLNQGKSRLEYLVHWKGYSEEQVTV